MKFNPRQFHDATCSTVSLFRGLCERRHRSVVHYSSSPLPKVAQAAGLLTSPSLSASYPSMLNSLRTGPLRLGRVRFASATSYGRSRILANPARLQFSSPTVSAIAPCYGLHITRRQQHAQAVREADPVPDGSESYEDGASVPYVTRFADLAQHGMASEVLVRTLTENMNLDTMTEVQSKTINETLRGQDMLGQARTGTGKTLAFLLPVLQRIINDDPSLEHRRGKGAQQADIRAVIVSPTRELAEQIHAEAKRVVAHTNIQLQLAVGGTSKKYHLDKLRREGCHLLVGTPGRLKDLLSDPYSGVRAPNLSALVLDEADRLLDDGFGPDILEIEKLLPNRRSRDRQTLMFSATFPQEVMSMVGRLMKPEYKLVQTVQPGEQQTHERVPQRVVHLRGLENYLPALFELFQKEINDTERAMPFKAIVFFNASALATHTFHVFRAARDPAPAGGGRGTRAPTSPFFGVDISEMHAKLPQQRRTRTAEDFRRARSAILFSSDVSSRGMDFPNVTHVVSVGLPPQADTYVHRIGRTARINKPGESWLLLSPMETREANRRLKGFPLRKDASLAAAAADMERAGQMSAESMGVPATGVAALAQARAAVRAMNPGLHAPAFLGLFGVYQWHPRKEDLVDEMNRLAEHGWGMERPPPVSPMLAQKLGLARCSALRIEARREDAWRQGREGLRTRSRHGYGREQPYRQSRGGREWGQ